MKKTTNSNPLKYFNDVAAAKKKTVTSGNDKLVKAQYGASVKPTTDSSKYYKDEIKFQGDLASNASKFGLTESSENHIKKARKAKEDLERQSLKGRQGYDANGFPIKTKKK